MFSRLAFTFVTLHSPEMSLNTTSGTKKWGLQKPSSKKTPKHTLTASSAFGDSDDDDDDSDNSTSKAYHKKQQQQKEAARLRAEQTLLSIQNDNDDINNSPSPPSPSDNAYDKHHDALQAERDRAARRSEEQRELAKSSGPQYMQNLLKTAKMRELERDKAHTRKLVKEQEEEEHEFAGKERFITSSYKRKLEEREAYEKLNAADDVDIVSRKGGMSNFYANMNSIKNGVIETEEEEVEGRGDLAPSVTAPTPAAMTMEPTIVFDDATSGDKFLGQHKKKEKVVPSGEEIKEMRLSLVKAARDFYFSNCAQ